MTSSRRLLLRGESVQARSTWFATLVTLVLSGCGQSKATFEGRVTHEGDPAVGAEIEFRSTVDKRVRCSAVVLDDGKYQVDYGVWGGLPPGECRIIVTHFGKPKTTTPGDDLDGEQEEQDRRVRRRQVFFVRDVSGGVNQVDLEIKDGQALSPG